MPGGYGTGGRGGGLRGFGGYETSDQDRGYVQLEDEGIAPGELYGPRPGYPTGSPAQTIREVVNPQATWGDWFTGGLEGIFAALGADPQFGRRDVFGIPGQTSRDFTRAAAGLYGPQEPWSVEASPLGGILGTVGVRLAPEEGQSRMYRYSPSEQGEETDFTFKDLLPGSWFEDKPAVPVSEAVKRLRDSETVEGPFIDGVEARTRYTASPQSSGIPVPPTYRVDPRGGGILEDRDYNPPRRPWPWPGQSFDHDMNQGGPVVKQYQEGGDVLSPDRLTPSFVPMNPQAAEQIRDSFMKVFEAAPVGNNLEYRQKANRALYEQLMAPEQATFLLQLQEVAKIYPEVDVKLKEIMSVEEPFGGMMENVAGGYPQQGSRLPSERIMEETVSTVPGFSGVADQGFTPGGPISGDVFPPQMQRGGHVGRGTMAGELAPRGSLPVREAGESMYERFKRLHGYDQGGYIGRGTQAGEIMPRGSRSVREEGETMYELAKRREDERNYQGGGPVHHGPSSGVRRLREATLSPSMQRRIF